MKSSFIRLASGVSCYPYLQRIMALQPSVLPSRLSAQIHHTRDSFFQVGSVRLETSLN